jgi:PHD/YefM family antitoxin component YafN of YafNO toxin-antitoxin module
MALPETATRISIADAIERGVDALVGEVENGHEFVVVRDDKPVAVVVSGERFEQWQQLQDDLIDITLVAARMLTSRGPSVSLDEALERFGYTREGLADKPTPESDVPLSVPPASAQSGFRSVDPATHPLVGKWRIVEMTMFDSEYIDLVEPGYIAFGPRGQGDFAFGAVTASLDLWYAPSSIDFTWRGSDEGDEVFGAGSAELDDDGVLVGEIRFGYGDGDETEFKAQRWPDPNIVASGRARP